MRFFFCTALTGERGGMGGREGRDRECAAQAALRHGCLSLEQAIRFGMSQSAVQRRVASGRWRLLRPAVYLIAGMPPTEFSALSAGVLWAGSGAALSHCAAAALWKLDGFAPRLELSTLRELRSTVASTRLHRVVLLPHSTCSAISWLLNPQGKHTFQSEYRTSRSIGEGNRPPARPSHRVRGTRCEGVTQVEQGGHVRECGNCCPDTHSRGVQGMKRVG